MSGRNRVHEGHQSVTIIGGALAVVSSWCQEAVDKPSARVHQSGRSMCLRRPGQGSPACAAGKTTISEGLSQHSTRQRVVFPQASCSSLHAPLSPSTTSPTPNSRVDHHLQHGQLLLTSTAALPQPSPGHRLQLLSQRLAELAPLSWSLSFDHHNQGFQDYCPHLTSGFVKQLIRSTTSESRM
jgi:hypothetical protein